jgi:hypothetical protein
MLVNRTDLVLELLNRAPKASQTSRFLEDDGHVATDASTSRSMTPFTTESAFTMKP